MPDAIECGAGLIEGANTGGGDAIETAGTTGSHGVSFFKAGREKLLLLETIERGVDGAGRCVAVEGELDGTKNGAAIGVVAETVHGEEDGLFERTEECSHVYIVDIKAMAVGQAEFCGGPRGVDSSGDDGAPGEEGGVDVDAEVGAGVFASVAT